MPDGNIEDRYLTTAANALAYAATHEPLPAGVIIAVAGPSNEQSSFQAVYEALLGLPEDHPLIREHGRETLKKGYDRRTLYGVEDTSEACGDVCLKLNQPVSLR